MSDKVIRLLGAWSGNARMAGAIALGGLKEEKAVKPLIEMLAKDPDDEVRAAAQEALGKITGQNFGWNWQAWRRWLEGDGK